MKTGVASEPIQCAGVTYPPVDFERAMHRRWREPQGVVERAMKREHIPLVLDAKAARREDFEALDGDVVLVDVADAHADLDRSFRQNRAAAATCHNADFRLPVGNLDLVPAPVQQEAEAREGDAQCAGDRPEGRDADPVHAALQLRRDQSTWRGLRQAFRRWLDERR